MPSASAPRRSTSSGSPRQKCPSTCSVRRATLHLPFRPARHAPLTARDHRGEVVPLQSLLRGAPVPADRAGALRSELEVLGQDERLGLSVSL